MFTSKPTCHMESNWTRADFKNYGKLEGAPAELLRTAHEALARELELSLSAFLRTNVSASFASWGELSFGDLQREQCESTFGSVMARPGDRRLLVELEYSVLFPLICIALGAKPGSLSASGRKPTDIEFQVVHILFRLILAEAYRAWAPLVKTQLETVALGIEQTPFRTFPSTDAVYVTRFELTVGEHTGKLMLVAPQELFQSVVVTEEPVHRQQADAGVSAEATLQLMMPAKVSMDVWLDGSQMRLSDLLQLRAGQVVKLDHPVDRRAICTLNGKPGFTGQIVSTGAHRAFLVEDFTI